MASLTSPTFLRCFSPLVSLFLTTSHFEIIRLSDYFILIMHQLKIPNSDFSGIFTTQGLSYFATWLIGSVLRVAECSLTLSLLRHLGFGPISHEAHLEGGGPLRLRWFVGPQDQKASFPLTRVPF